MNLWRHRLTAITARLGFCGLALITQGYLHAVPRLPQSEDEVLIRLPTSLTRSEVAKLRELRQAPAPGNDQLPAALTLARKLIHLARADGDPRHLSQAQSVLAPWWNMTDAPVDVVLLRATIRQSLHDFDQALADLSEVLRRDPQNGQAWLTRTVILTVRADYVGARDACLQAMRFCHPLAATTAAAALGGMTGRAESAHNLLERALAAAPPVNPTSGSDERTIRVWAWTTLGELAERQGQFQEAERYFDTALALEPRDPAALATWADFLLSRKRPREVLNRLRDFEENDALLLRLAEAQQQLVQAGSGQEKELIRQRSLLRERFARAHSRSTAPHLREEARFELRLGDNPARALELAQGNWETQREWTDACLLLEAAEAAGDQKTTDAMRQLLRPSANASERGNFPAP